MSVGVDLDRCTSCRALVDAEDLFCANCGTEAPHEAGRAGRVATEARNFQCRGCGASMNYDASARSLKCPFCGSVDLAEDPSRGVLAPELVIPFALGRDEAERRLRAFLGSSFWHPSDLRRAAHLTDLRAVYVPFWIFATHARTHWTADSSETPPGARADWYPVSGRRQAAYQDLWVPASAGVPLDAIRAILPFDPSAGVPPDRVDLVDVTVEQFTVSRRYARPHLQGLVESLESQAAAREVPGRSRNVKVNVLLEGATSRGALAPVYIMAYRYDRKLYRYVVNGQTGEATGSAPVSMRRIGQVAGLAAVAIVLILLLVLLFAR